MKLINRKIKSQKKRTKVIFKESMAENVRAENTTNMRNTMYTSRINTKTHLDGLTAQAKREQGKREKQQRENENHPRDSR